VAIPLHRICDSFVLCLVHSHAHAFPYGERRAISKKIRENFPKTPFPLQKGGKTTNLFRRH
jgi:hypothetical protein